MEQPKLHKIGTGQVIKNYKELCKILEIKVSNKRSWIDMKSKILDEEKKKIDEKYNKEYNEQFIQNKMYYHLYNI